MKLVGNQKVKEQLWIALKAAKERNRSIPHILFSGHAGCGKTSMAKKLAQVSDVKFIPIVAETLSDYNSVYKTLELLDDTNYDSKGNTTGEIKPSIIFIDEIHGMPLKGQEYLGIAMENFLLEHKTPGKYIWTPYFTVVGATTMEGKLSKPFLDRFGFKFVFKPYRFSECVEIVKTHAERLQVPITEEAILSIVKRGRGTPRILVRFLERVRDTMLATGAKVVDINVAELTFTQLNIDPIGLTETEVGILKYLYEVGEPIGLDNLSIVTGEDRKSITESIEPYLIRSGLIARTGKGRILTEKGATHIETGGNHKDRKKETIEINYIRR